MDRLENSSDQPIVVVKVGTTTLTRGQPRINKMIVADLARQIVAVRNGEGDGQPRRVILVSSAAIAMGRQRFGLAKATQLSANLPTETVLTKQMLAAIGQPQLMQLYQQIFADHYDILTAQALLTYTNFSTEQQRANARDTLLDLLAHEIVPIVNENDVVATEEIKFGDNDRLSALVAELVGAALLVIMSDIDGLYTANPRLDSQATLIPQVASIDDKIVAMAGGSLSQQGTGGMYSKVLAAQVAAQAGITTMLVNGEKPDALIRAVAGEKFGTRFLAYP